MVHDFTLIYALDSGMGLQEDVLRQLADSDCAKVANNLTKSRFADFRTFELPVFTGHFKKLACQKSNNSKSSVIGVKSDP